MTVKSEHVSFSDDKTPTDSTAEVVSKLIGARVALDEALKTMIEAESYEITSTMAEYVQNLRLDIAKMVVLVT